MAHPEDVLSTLNEVILILDDVLEVGDFFVPVFADGTSLSGHGGHTSEGFGPVVEIVDKGLGFSFVFLDFGFENTGTNGVTSGSSWWEDDTSGASTINFGSHVGFPVVEFFGFTFGSFLQGGSSGLHLGLDFNQLFTELK